MSLKNGWTIQRISETQRYCEIPSYDHQVNPILSEGYSDQVSQHNEIDYSSGSGKMFSRLFRLSVILGVIEDDKIIGVSREIGTEIPKQFMLFWFKKTNLECLSLVCRYAEFAQYEVDADETNYTITLIHDLWEMVSVFRELDRRRHDKYSWNYSSVRCKQKFSYCKISHSLRLVSY